MIEIDIASLPSLQWVDENADAMRLSDSVLKYAVFLCAGRWKTKRRRRAGGTAFFVEVPAQDNQGNHSYIVTARHVIEEIQHTSSDQVYVKINVNSTEDRPAGVRYIGVPFARWQFPRNPTIDLAVALWNPTPSKLRLQYETVPLDMLATIDFIREEMIGIGELIFYPGCFTSHQETTRNIPIVRTGHIAAMPHEPFRDKHRDVEAYLVEAFSIGGFSGAPVFIGYDARRGPAYTLKDYRAWGPGDPPPIIREDEPEFARVIGVMSGHFRHKQPYGTIHSGLSFVVPAVQLRELFQQEDVMREQRKKEQKERTSVKTSLDSGFPLLSPEQFHQTLKRVSRKRVPGRGKP